MNFSWLLKNRWLILTFTIFTSAVSYQTLFPKDARTEIELSYPLSLSVKSESPYERLQNLALTHPGPHALGLGVTEEAGVITQCSGLCLRKFGTELLENLLDSKSLGTFRGELLHSLQLKESKSISVSFSPDPDLSDMISDLSHLVLKTTVSAPALSNSQRDLLLSGLNGYYQKTLEKTYFQFFIPFEIEKWETALRTLEMQKEKAAAFPKTPALTAEFSEREIRTLLQTSVALKTDPEVQVSLESYLKASESPREVYLTRGLRGIETLWKKLESQSIASLSQHAIHVTSQVRILESLLVGFAVTIFFFSLYALFQAFYPSFLTAFSSRKSA